MSQQDAERGRPVALRVIAREWTRIGVTGFGGPPAHIALLHELVVERTGWIDAAMFQDANAACALLPGPASTQLAILCALRVGGPAGATVGGLGFVLPSICLVIALAAFVLSAATPLWVRGAAAGASAAVAAVALHAGRGLAGPSWRRSSAGGRARSRWAIYVAGGGVAAVIAGSALVAVLIACGLFELVAQRHDRGVVAILALITGPAVATGGAAAIAWTALKVGALSFGGGFVIIPLMQGDAVHVHHWMTAQRFLDAVVLGQITPGPVMSTVAAVGYAAGGLGGALLASAVAFAPSFAFVLAVGGHLERLRAEGAPRAFLDGAGPAAIGAILGAAIVLAAALGPAWQFAVLGLAAIALLALRRGVVATLVLAAVIGTVAALAGLPVP